MQGLLLQDYAVYRDRHGQLDAMPLRASWNDTEVHRNLQGRVSCYLNPIAWQRIDQASSAQDAIERAVEAMEAAHADTLRHVVKKIPPSERAQAVRDIILYGKTPDRAELNPADQWYPLPKVEGRGDVIRRSW